MLEKGLDPESEIAKFRVNIEVLHKNFNEVLNFDESLRFEGPSLHLVGSRAQHFPFERYQKVFPNITQDDVIEVQDAGHWIHFD